MNKQILAKTKELLKYNSKEYTLNRLISEKTSRQSVTNLIKIVDEAEGSLTQN